jgi:hypothetical protein
VEVPRDYGRRLSTVLRKKGYETPDGQIDAPAALAAIRGRTGREIPEATFKGYCRGDRTPYIDEAADIARAIGFDVRMFWTDDAPEVAAK